MAALPDPARYPDHEIVALLGEGAMSRVWKARRRRDGRLVALKEPEPSSLEGEGLHRFVRTAHRWIELPKHPHVAQALHLCDDLDPPLLEMELVEGPTLEERIEQGRLSISEALDIALPIADALGRVHRTGLVHRDLKPANVILSKRGPKLVDFGIALAAPFVGSSPEASRLTATGVILGTPSYMSPEQAMGRRDLGPASDIFLLGILLHEMLTGELPFRGRDPLEILRRISDASLPAPKVVRTRPEVPPRLNHLVSRCLEKDRTLRPSSMEAILVELHKLRSGKGEPSLVVRRPPTQPARRLSEAILGRDEAVAVCQEALELVQTGTGSLLLLTGELGVGKSRFGREILRQAADRRLATLRGVAGNPGGRSFRPLYQALSSWAGERGVGSAADLREILTRLDPLLAGWCDLLAAFLHLPGARSEAITAEGPGLLEALEAFLKALAADRPLVLAIESLERADEGTLELLACLALEIQSLPLLAVGTLRTEETDLRGELGALLSHPGSRHAEIGRLAPEEGLALVAQRYPGLEDDPSLMRSLLQLSAGNPLLLLSILDQMAASEEIAMESGRWRLSKESGPLPLSRDIEGLLQGRLRRLPDLEGRVFEAGALAAGLENEGIEAISLSEALGIELDRVRRALFHLKQDHKLLEPTGDHYRLAHPVYREIVVRTMDPGLRKDIELRLGRSLVRSESPDPERIARHLWSGGDREAAIPFLERAAHRALRVEDNRAATELFGMWVDCDAERFDPHLGLGKALLHQGLYSRALESFDQALELAEDPGEHGEALLGRARSLHSLARVAECLTSLAEAEGWYEKAADSKGLGDCRMLRGMVTRQQGRLTDALEAYEEALEIYDRSAPVEQARVFDRMGRIHLERGETDLSRESYERALAGYRSAGNPRFEANARNNLGVLFLGLSRYGEALSHLRKALELRRSVADRRGLAATTMHLGVLWWTLGIHIEAEECCRRARDLFLRLEDVRMADLCQLYHAVALLGLDREDEEALHEIDQARNASLQRGEREAVLRCDFVLLDHLARSGRREAARPLFEDFRAEVKELGLRRFFPQVAFLRGLLEEDAETAREAFEEARRDAEQAKLAELAWEADWRLAQLLEEELGEASQARELYQRAARSIHELSESLDDLALREAYLEEPRRARALADARRAAGDAADKETRPIER